jgi:hypothetical protein
VFFPSKTFDADPSDFGLTYQNIYFDSDNFKIHSWFIPHKKSRKVLLFFHGNAGNISTVADKAVVLHDMGFSLFLIDYRGYGKSQGTPSEKGLYKDAESAYNYLVNSLSVDPNNIIVYGESLGTQVAADLALKKDLKGIILEGAFNSAKDIAKILYPFIPSFLFPDIFNTEKKIDQIRKPILFLHSVDDEMVPIKLAEKLYERTQASKKFVRLKGAHNTYHVDSEEKYTSAIKGFINNL